MYKSVSESQDCLLPESFIVKQRAAFKPVSTSVTFTEYDLLDQAGVWTKYEALLNRNDQVEALKAHKKTIDLQLWMRTHTPWGNCQTPMITSEAEIKSVIDS